MIDIASMDGETIYSRDSSKDASYREFWIMSWNTRQRAFPETMFTESVIGCVAEEVSWPMIRSPGLCMDFEERGWPNERFLNDLLSEFNRLQSRDQHRRKVPDWSWSLFKTKYDPFQLLASQVVHSTSLKSIWDGECYWEYFDLREESFSLDSPKVFHGADREFFRLELLKEISGILIYSVLTHSAEGDCRWAGVLLSRGCEKKFCCPVRRWEEA
jgi:hypothetical protein